MKRKYKIRLLAGSSALLSYITLLCVLADAESAASGTTIHSFGDALWYSVVTLTTVGYGDYSPITPVGRLIGVFFLLLSTGIMVTLLGTVVSFLTGEALPLFLLGRQKHKRWYYFADTGAEAQTLARNIYKQDSDAVIIFSADADEKKRGNDYPCLYTSTSLKKVIARKECVGEPCKVFLMKENDIGVNRQTTNIASLPVIVYARTASGQDHLPGNIHFFHSYDCCARDYWRSKALCRSEHNIVIIGFGSYGKAILKRAVLTNVISVHHCVTYHIFGGVDNFLQVHNHLHQVFSINEESDEMDSLLFYEENWAERHDILAQADRIIICEDDKEKGWDVFWQLQRYYVVTGRIDLRSNHKVAGVSYFGGDEELYTPEQVLKTKLNEVAIAMNNLYRQQHKYHSLSWDELDDSLRQSKIAAADHIFMKARILLHDESITAVNADILTRAYKAYREAIWEEGRMEEMRQLEHLRWLRFYSYYNWSYGEKRNDQLRLDPRIKPYSELTELEQRQCDFSWELIGAISLDS